MKTARQLSIFLLLTTGITAFYAGYNMITDPTGSSLGLPFYLLNGTVFTSYAITGWILLITVGIFSSLTIICIFSRFRFYSFLIMLQGVFLCIFIIVQMLLLGETFIIQYVLLIIGGGLIGLGALQNQRKIVVDAEKKLQVKGTGVKSHHHKHRKP
jgi:hypothetical protein